MPPALLVLAGACLLLTGAVALARPAAAIEDPRRPAAEVTHGPSCGPAVVRVAVTNGTVGHRVALVFDGTQEEDTAVLVGGEQAELASEDVDWGQTVDVSVTVTGADGAAEDPIEFGTYTRPSAEDCAAVAADSPEPGPEPGPAALPATPSAGTPTDPGSPPSPASTPTRPSTPPTPRSGSPAPAPGIPHSTPPASSPAGNSSDRPGGQAASASTASVSPGGIVTVRAAGFIPGEPVTISMSGVEDPLTTVTAAADGGVEAVLQIPRGTGLGTATVRLVGDLSDATAGLDLQVAARVRPVPEQATSVPVLAAGIALVCTAAVLGLTAARRSRAHHTTLR